MDLGERRTKDARKARARATHAGKELARFGCQDEFEPLFVNDSRFAQHSSRCCWIGLRSRQLLNHEGRESSQKVPLKCGG